jgi:hypothetical protein
MINRTPAAALLLTAAIAGCTTSPADYATGLPSQDPKWLSPECQEARVAAAGYETGERPLYWSAGALLGPYGLAIVAAGKDHQAKQRKLFVRDMHLKCSSQPLPKELALVGPSGT